MRTDAKIGFAIGAVLLAVLTVYAIVVPRHRKSANTVSLVTPVQANPVPGTADGSSSGSSMGGSSSSSISSNGSSSGSQSTPPIAAADSGSQVSGPTPSNPSSNSSSTMAPPAASAQTGTTPMLADNSSSSASTDGFHPLNAPTDMARADDQSGMNAGGMNNMSINSSGANSAGSSGSGKLVDGVYTPDRAVSKIGKSRRSNSTDSVLPDETDTASATTDTLYTIKPGQTLSKIAYEVYGNSRFWVVIQRENKGLDANHLKVGSKVKLPDISTVVPGPITVSDEEVAPLAAANSPSPRHHHEALADGVLASDGHSYTVKSGDSLYAIARRLLGSGRKADTLYDLNKDVIGPDKSRLKLGMILKLPEVVRTALAS